MSITKNNMKSFVEKANAVWLKYVSTKNKTKNNPNVIHCFFEGEDGKYYLERVERFCKKNPEDIYVYNCTGKHVVQSLFAKINGDNSEEVKNAAFFTDRDYDLDNEFLGKTLYITKYYSLEKYYTSISAFGKMIRTEMNLNQNDQIFTKVMNDYTLRLNEYRIYMSNINALFKSFLKIGGELSFKKFEEKDFVEIGLRQLNEKYPNDLDSLIKYYSDKLIKDVQKGKENAEEKLAKFNTDIENVRKIFNDELLEVVKKLEIMTHGKMELYFLKQIIEDIKFLINQKLYFEDFSVKLKCDTNNMLSSLSSYADTPECLVKFLEKYNQYTDIKVAN